MATLPAVPRTNAVLANAGRWLIDYVWDNWFQTLARAVNSTPQVVGTSPSLTHQAAAIAARTLLTVPSDGLYRITTQMRVTQAAGVSSSVTIALNWQDGGILQGMFQTPLTGNTTTTQQSTTTVVRADAGSLITLTTGYGSVGAPVMQYAIDSRVESLP